MVQPIEQGHSGAQTRGDDTAKATRLAAVPGMVLTILLLGLAGCSQDRSFADLEQFVDEANAQPSGRIEPLPEFEQQRPFAYSAAGLRSPFERPQAIKPLVQAAAGKLVKPDPNRPKEYLEQFPINDLRMVGTISRGSGLFGLVREPSGRVHRVASGAYIGLNHGRIDAVTEADIAFDEIVSDGVGGWIERGRAMRLNGEVVAR